MCEPIGLLLAGTSAIPTAGSSCTPARRAGGRFRLQVLVMHGSDVSGDEWWLVRASICHGDQDYGFYVWESPSYQEQYSQELSPPGRHNQGTMLHLVEIIPCIYLIE